MVNTLDRDGAPWGMGHMGDRLHGQWGTCETCARSCVNFLNTAWIFTKNFYCT